MEVGCKMYHDNVSQENLFNEDEGFFKSLLSFMDDSDDSSCTSGYASEIFSLDNVVTSGYLDSTQHYGDLIYKKCNFSNRLYTSWTRISAGLRPSAKESSKITVYKDYQELTTSKSICEWPVKTDIFNKDLKRDFKPTVKDKNLMFAKFLRNSSLPEFQNHPARPKQISKESVTPQRNDFHTVRKNPTSYQNSDQDKENIGPSTRKLKICKFCFKNGEPAVVYLGHILKTSAGIVTCPILQRYTCEICGATGTKSHTRKYCPLNTEPFELVPPFRRLTNGILTRSLHHK